MTKTQGLPPAPHEKIKRDLLALAHQRQEQLQNVLVRYALERFLYRLTISSYAHQFVLKGAMLFTLWTGEPHRATKDIDLLGQGDASRERVEEIFRAICSIPLDDGLTFPMETIHADRIKEGQQYEGVRVAFTAYLGKALMRLQVDIGFGDAITPGPVLQEYPTLLALAKPHVLTYPRETVIAEKFQALVALGMANSRIKDFYDLWVLSRDFAYSGPMLAEALAATFARRGTPLPTVAPLALTPAFCSDVGKVRLWNAFVQKGQLQAGLTTLSAVGAILCDFLMPPSQALASSHTFWHHWEAGGPWLPHKEHP